MASIGFGNFAKPKATSRTACKGDWKRFQFKITQDHLNKEYYSDDDFPDPVSMALKETPGFDSLVKVDVQHHCITLYYEKDYVVWKMPFRLRNWMEGYNHRGVKVGEINEHVCLSFMAKGTWDG